MNDLVKRVGECLITVPMIEKPELKWLEESKQVREIAVLEPIPLTVNEKRDLSDLESCQAAGLIAHAPGQYLFMDSHGCDVILVPCKRESDGALFGFTYRQSSEEPFFDDDPMEAIPIVGKEVVKIEYTPANGKEWNEIV